MMMAKTAAPVATLWSRVLAQDPDAAVETRLKR
jgi:hypothetical protein